MSLKSVLSGLKNRKAHRLALKAGRAREPLAAPATKPAPAKPVAPAEPLKEEPRAEESSPVSEEGVL